jgi:hypothetical protein
MPARMLLRGQALRAGIAMEAFFLWGGFSEISPTRPKGAPPMPKLPAKGPVPAFLPTGHKHGHLPSARATLWQGMRKPP